ncbi:PqqD family peptide modification chaperone [Synechococcus sp. ATX 2A4]|uniref:PqqD family peptide modification chaperone n=1 Tax=Synechococcus sp. ATX 2A4 TaxID=2823727 RepID=UPI0020CC42C1|nr:PqqD family peptide modification chaperone [Synechococcus sp. ATX 2A4]MCP9884664.1 PqqD family peptide modification chaperone [Synechococcus sp. ATX 2A4]
MDLRSGAYFGFSDSAATAWQMVGPEGVSTAGLAAAMRSIWPDSTDVIEADVCQFVDQLFAHDLIVPITECPSPLPAPEGQVQAYGPPALQKHSDLQDLFLLDPVHEVDPAVGWPHLPGQGSSVALVVAPDHELLVARAPDVTLLIDRTTGLYAALEGEANQLWSRIASGPTTLTTGPFTAALLQAGFAVVAPPVGTLAPSSEAIVTTPEPLPAPPLAPTLHRDLVDTLRPWITRPRPLPAAEPLPAQVITAAFDAYAATTAERCGSDFLEQGFRLGDRHLVLRTLPGQDIEALLPALAHRAETAPSAQHAPAHAAPADNPPALTITLFTATDLPASAPLAQVLLTLGINFSDAIGLRGELLALQGSGLSGHYDPGTRLLAVLDGSGGQAWVVKRDEAPLPFWELGSPLRFLLHEWFAAEGLQFVHGACVGGSRGGVLLAGPGGAGKSTTALMCVAAGLRYVGDDYCLADPARGWIHSLYGTGKLKGPEDFQRLPGLEGQAINADAFERGGTGKAVLPVASLWPERMAAGLPLQAILLPRLSSDPAPRLEPCSVAELLLSLVPSTVGQLPAADDGDCRRLVQLVAGLPAYVLHLGADPSLLPAVIEALTGR